MCNHAEVVTPAVLSIFRFQKITAHEKFVWHWDSSGWCSHFSSKRAVSQKRLPQSDVSKTANNQGEIYARLTSYNQTNTEVVRFKIDDNVFKMTKDLELRGNIEAMQSTVQSLSEALNVLASQGWKVHSTFVVRGRHGDEQVYLMSYTTEIGALYPWREKGQKAQSPKR